MSSNYLKIFTIMRPFNPAVLFTIAYCLLPNAFFCTFAANKSAMINNDQIKDITGRRDALRRYL